MTKVLEIFGEPISRGGQESFVMNALQNMDLSELTVDLFTPYYCDNSAVKQFIGANKGKIYAAGLPFMPGKSRRNIIPVLNQYFKNNQYDIVHIHSGSITALAYCARTASKAGTRKVIVHSHSSGANDNYKHKIIKAYTAPLLKKYVTDYCACSTGAAEWKFPSVVMKKVRIINNGVNADFFAYDPQTRDSMREEYEIEKDTLVIGHIGRFTYEKNQIFLLDVFKQYKRNHPEKKARLILLGEGNQKETVIKKAKNLGMKDEIIFPTEYDKARDYLQMFDIFVFPSLYEGFGIAGIEAQAAGLPVIASTGVPEAIQVIDNVRFVPLDNLEAWCEAIDFLGKTTREDTRDQIREKGFDIKDTVKTVQMLYDIQ